jgi:hypothetical protein
LGVATAARLPKAARAATIESKTSFFAAIPVAERSPRVALPIVK